MVVLAVSCEPVQCVLTALEEDSAGLGDVTTLSTCATAPSKPAQGAGGLLLQRATLTVWRAALLQAGACAGGCHSCELTAVHSQTRPEGAQPAAGPERLQRSVAAGTRASATFLAKADGVVAGLAVVDAVRVARRICRRPMSHVLAACQPL